MKKIYSILVLMLLIPTMAGAWSFDMLDENPVLQGEDYNLELTKNYNFFNAIYNGEPMVDADGNRVQGDGCLTTAPDLASIKLNRTDVYQVISPVCMKNFYLGNSGTGAINMRANVNRDGLHNYGSGSRYFAIGDMKAGQVVVCQWGVSQGSNVVQPTTAISGGDASTWTDISATVHEAQANMTDEEGNPLTPDNFTYWRIDSDGFLVIEMQRYSGIQGIQIWADASADEYVTSPTFAVSQVDFSKRFGLVEEGTSSKGFAVTTWYSLDGTDPIRLKESDEVEKTDTLYTYDDEGNVVDEQVVVTYKKVLDPIEEGIYGEQQYFSEDGISFDQNDDDDGDGYVELKIATVSESGKAFSDIITYKVAVEEITLNEPTLTLVGLNGTERSYRIDWNNNTLCHEPVTIKVDCDGDVTEDHSVGSIVAASEYITVTVSAEGYNDGVYNLPEVFKQGVDMFRKNQENEAAGIHDWDFVITDDATKAKIKGEEMAYCYLESNPDIHYSSEEYENSEAADGTDLSAAIPVYANYGWDWDAGNLRATLHVNKTQDEDGNDVLIEGGVDPNSDGYGYTGDKLNILNNNGLSISCPPNAKNNSTILQYLDKADGDGNLLGIYFMARPTLTFQREVAEYGDFVLVYQGAGGSNYTNSKWFTLNEVPADELLTFQLNNNGIHLFYIDIYTSDKGDDYEDPYVVGVKNIESTPYTQGNVYTLDGRLVRRNADLNGLQKGMYILNGKKIIVK